MRSMACFNVSCTDRNAANTDGLKKKRGGEGRTELLLQFSRMIDRSPVFQKLERNERTYVFRMLSSCVLAFLSALTTRRACYFCLCDWVIDVSERRNDPWSRYALALHAYQSARRCSRKEMFCTVIDRSLSLGTFERPRRLFHKNIS